MSEIEKFKFDRPTMTRPHPIRARLTASEWVANETLKLAFEPVDEAMFDFLPGQYVSIMLDAVEAQGLKKDVRAYSMWNHPSEERQVVTIVKMVDGGRCSQWLKTLQPGDELTFLAPVGAFWLRRPLHSTLIFVATGTGLVPLRSMLRDMEEKGEFEGRKVTLLFGVRHADDLFAVDELNAMATRLPDFTFVPTLSRPGPDWTGACGYVTAHLADLDFPVDDMQVYLCGNGGMIDDVLALCEQRGLSLKTRRIVLEKYFD